MGRKNCITYGVVTLSLATTLFALAALFTDQWTFFWLACFARALQGLGDCIVIVPTYSVITLEFPENNEVYQGYLNMTLAAGLCLGPAIAVRWFGFIGTNLFFSVLILVFGLSGVYLLPASINDVQARTDGSEEKGQRDILYSSFFKNKWSLMALLAKGVGQMSF